MYCYQFPDKETFVASCETLGWVSEGVVSAYTHDRAIDEIGPITVTPGTYDDDGTELTAPVIIDLHHVNFQGEPPEEWDEYLVEVSSPSRQFAGSNGSSVTLEELEEQRGS